MKLLTSTLLVAVFIAEAALPASAGPLRVVATTPNLGSLIASVGGAHVEVTTLAKGPQDPHSLEPRPSFITKLHRADLFVLVGMELEQGWVPPLLRSARNPKVLPGASGYLDASTAIAPLEIPTAAADRSMGDVHPYGNPHYLTDPLNGVRVARLIRDRLSARQPEHEATFTTLFEAFSRATAERLVGADWVARHGTDATLRAIGQGTLGEWTGEEPLAGWLGSLPPPGTNAIEDHQFWAYFAARFGLNLVGRLEPRPGVPPTTRHLGQVIETMNQREIPLILASAYFDPRHARWVSERTGASVVSLAHQPGARPDTPDYLSTIDFNVRALATALKGR